MDEVLKAEIEFGATVEEFLNSQVGRYLIGCADQDIEEATNELKDADPENPKIIRDLQNKIYRAESIRAWLFNAVEAGQLSFEQLDSGENDE